MRYLLLVIAGVFFINNNLNCQDKKNILLISGVVDSTLLQTYQTKEIVIRERRTMGSGNDGAVYVIPLNSKGFFKTKILSPDSLSYFSFELENKTKDNWTGRFYIASFPRKNSLPEAYLMQAGDSVFVQIGKQGWISFRGRGAEKLNCQWQINNIEPYHQSFQSRIIDLLNQHNLEGHFDLKINAMKLGVDMRLMIMRTYQGQLSPAIYNILCADAVATTLHKGFSAIKNMLWEYPSDSAFAMIRNFYLRMKEFARSIPELANVGGMGYYADLVYEMETDALLVASIGNSNKEIGNALYQQLKAGYSGMLKDNLLYLFFKIYGKMHSMEVRPLVDDAILTIADVNLKKQLSDWSAKRYQAFAFTLYDEKDRVRELKDFKNKLVVIDFWFTGCGPCLRLGATMDSIIEKYRDNNDIVFLSVSTDHKNVWMRSLKSGLYTSPGMINLHTNGRGFTDPLIKNYEFNGFPQQLIISKDGELITSSPPRADVSEANKKAFMKIIEYNL
jgi:thiol-disulfide isomerase/thioredoxin